MPVKRVIPIFALMYACLSALAAPPAQITLSKDGWFRTGRGELFVPLGGSHHVGVPDESPLEVRFDLPKGRYRVRPIDLTDDRDETRSVAAKDSLKLSGKTNHDYVLVVSR